MRSKEDALDYRYFPEPDMPELRLNDEMLKRLDEQTIEIPYDVIKRFKEYGFNKEFINAIISDKVVLQYFIAFCRLYNQDPKIVANWLCGPIIAWTKENNKPITELNMKEKQFGDFLKISEEGAIMYNQLKIIMDEMLATGRDPEAIIKEK
jgi:aspartyl-tRNA(Asn)/glutamyl-tRNA(Gln) amidotransferase subunit B